MWKILFNLCAKGVNTKCSKGRLDSFKDMDAHIIHIIHYILYTCARMFKYKVHAVNAGRTCEKFKRRVTEVRRVKLSCIHSRSRERLPLIMKTI